MNQLENDSIPYRLLCSGYLLQTHRVCLRCAKVSPGPHLSRKVKRKF